MTTPDPNQPNAKASQEALEWHVRLTSGAATEEDWQAHLDWLSADPANLMAFDHVQQSWAALDEARGAVLKAFPVTGNKAASPSLAGRVFGGIRRIVTLPARVPVWQTALAGVAVVVLLVLAGTQIPLLMTPKPRVYATAIGEVRTVRLADGSTAALDTDTRIQVLYKGQERTAKLDHGSVLFDVAHNENRPFLVTAGNHRIEVLGTKFEVSERDRQTAVSVARGIVAVSPMQVTTGGRPAQAERVEKGQRIVYATPTSAPVRYSVNPQDVGSWDRGQLVFNAQPLSAVVKRLNDYFPSVKLEIGDPSLRNMTFTGVVKLTDPKSTARRLAELMSLDFTNTGTTLRLTARKSG